MISSSAWISNCLLFYQTLLLQVSLDTITLLVQILLLQPSNSHITMSECFSFIKELFLIDMFFQEPCLSLNLFNSPLQSSLWIDPSHFFLSQIDSKLFSCMAVWKHLFKRNQKEKILPLNQLLKMIRLYMLKLNIRLNYRSYY